MELKINDTSITEPVTANDVKAYLNIPAATTTWDTLISGMITMSREYFERMSALSVVSKSYTAYFETTDEENGWFELPVSPVLSSPAIVCSINGAVVTYQQKGMDTVFVSPDILITTVLIDEDFTDYYLSVTFQAGATSAAANECIKKLTAIQFNHRDDYVGVNAAHVPFGVMQMIRSLSRNL